ncbi:MAG: ATP-binding cassette domain-containing protein [Mariprofundaceae bacterium]
MIQMNNLILRYPTGKMAVAGVNLDIDQGAFVYLTGESGAGKSSILRLIYGGLRPTSGQMQVQKTDMRTASEQQLRMLRQRIGIIFQNHRLLPARTVFENVALPLRVQNWKVDRLIARVEKVLEFVGLESRLWSFPETLSGGEQQRVAIARAMVANPALILADEPTGNLDHGTSCRVLDYMMALNQSGTTIIMATHDLHLLHSHPGHVVQLHAGAIQASGHSKDFAYDASPATA